MKTFISVFNVRETDQTSANITSVNAKKNLHTNFQTCFLSLTSLMLLLGMVDLM